MSNRNTVVVSYPNTVGDAGPYTVVDQREYFSRFDGGARQVFELALSNCVDGDIVSFQAKCNEIFENYYAPQFLDNTANLNTYNVDQKEFYRRTINVYRYAKTSLARLSPQFKFNTVVRLKDNQKFDSGSFLLK